MRRCFDVLITPFLHQLKNKWHQRCCIWISNVARYITFIYMISILDTPPHYKLVVLHNISNQSLTAVTADVIFAFAMQLIGGRNVWMYKRIGHIERVFYFHISTYVNKYISNILKYGLCFVLLCLGFGTGRFNNCSEWLLSLKYSYSYECLIANTTAQLNVGKWI